MTKRTYTDLITNLFQDGQVAGSITPADMRDFIESMKFSFGGLYISAAAATTISVAGAYYKAAGTTTLYGAEDTSDGSTDNRIVYTGTPDRNFFVLASISMTSASSNQVISYKLAKNGTVIDSTYVTRKVGTGSDVGALAVAGYAALSTNDYLEMYVTNETTASNVTLETMNMMAFGIFA